MDCPRWNDEWIAHLYGELDPAEERSLTAHLGECPACRGEIERLGATRLLLHASSDPNPAPSRVMVLSTTRRMRPVLAFAAGVASAAALFLAGSFAGSVHREPQPPAVDTAEATLLDTIGEQSRRLEQLEHAVRDPRPVASDPALLTRDDFRQSLDQLENRWQEERARELEFLVRSISVAQARVDETQEALQVLAIRDDPRYRER